MPEAPKARQVLVQGQEGAFYGQEGAALRARQVRFGNKREQPARCCLVSKKKLTDEGCPQCKPSTQAPFKKRLISSVPE